MAWVGVHPADKQTMLKVLAHTSAGGLPEGIAGIFTGADRGIERLYFNRRKGYIKVAIEAGVDLVPIFVLGQSEVYSYKGLEKLSRRLKAAVGIFYGRAYTWLPYKTDMVVLVGKPIKVRQEDNPSEQQVDNIQEQMKQELSDMFYRHRHFHPGWAHRELEFV
jgi:2-acylglycerol O-acyltransferase 2